MDLVQALRVNCVVDVGANTGGFSKSLRMNGFEGNIFSFDPLHENCEAMRLLAADDPRWTVFELALGSTSERRAFNVISTTVGTAQLVPHTHQGCRRGNAGRRGCTTRRGSSELAARRPRATRVPEDRHTRLRRRGRQGGGKRDGCDHRPAIGDLGSPIYEGMPHYTQALECYESLGFVLMNLLVVNRRPNGNVLEYDCLMAKEDQLLGAGK